MDEDKLRKILNRFERALELIDNSEVNEAIKILRLTEERFDAFEKIDPDLKIITFHNLAMCYQLLNDLKLCSKYIKNVLKSLKTKVPIQHLEKIRISRYKSLLLIQLSALSSHLNSHDNSIKYAKKAFDSISNCLNYCVNSPDPQSLSFYEQSNIQILQNCLDFLSGKNSTIPSTQTIIQRTSLGVLHYTDWIYSFSIDSLLDLSPLKYFELKNSHSFTAEFSKNYMLEKVCLLMFTCYLVATETRFMRDPIEKQKAKGWHSRAVDIGLALLPLESPILQHIKSSYDKHYPTVPLLPKFIKSKTPIRIHNLNSTLTKSKTPVRLQLPSHRAIKMNEVKTERNVLRNRLKIDPIPHGNYLRSSTRKEKKNKDTLLCEDFSIQNKTVIINSSDLYGTQANSGTNKLI